MRSETVVCSVDYDNVRLHRDINRSDVVLNLSEFFDAISDQVSIHFDDTEELQVRLYGGRVDEVGRYTALAEWLLAERPYQRGLRNGIRVLPMLSTTVAQCEPSAEVSDAEKSYRVEKYYEPNFPVLLQEDLVQLESAIRKVALRIAGIYWERRQELEEAFAGCSLESRGYQLDDVLDFVYSKIRRTGREILDEQGFFPELPVHRDGSRWVYWAEEVESERLGDGEQPSR